jgi:hypothetical protein
MTDTDRTAERAAEEAVGLSPLPTEPEVLVEGTWFKVADLPEILGNFMRAAAEHGREAKHLASELAEIRGRYGDLVCDKNDLTTENEQLSARVGDLEDQLAKARAELDALGEGDEEWAVRVFTRADQKHWFHQWADADAPEESLASSVRVAADSSDPGTGKPPVNHGFAVVKRTVRSTEWETVKTVPATGEPTSALDGERAKEVIGPDTLCPCGKVNDGTGSGYCSYEHFDEYDGWNL